MATSRYSLDTGEGTFLYLPGSRAKPSGRRLVLFAHGYNGSAAGAPYETFFRVPADVLGLPCLAVDAGGLATWGNDAAVNAIAAAWSWAKTNLDIKTDKFVLTGGSMGFATAFNYASRNPTQVKALVGAIPVTSLLDIHDNNIAGYAASIEAAHGGATAWNAAKATRDPTTAAASVAAIPQRLYNAVADPVCRPTAIDAYVTAVGVNASKITHDPQGVNSGHATNNLDVADLAAFLAPYV